MTYSLIFRANAVKDQTSALAARMMRIETTAMPVSTTVQVFSVWVTDMPRYSFTNQKPDAGVFQDLAEAATRADDEKNRCCRCDTLLAELQDLLSCQAAMPAEGPEREEDRNQHGYDGCSNKVGRLTWLSSGFNDTSAAVASNINRTGKSIVNKLSTKPGARGASAFPDASAPSPPKPTGTRGAIQRARKGPVINAVGKPITIDHKMVLPVSAPIFPMASMGPGCGGIRPWATERRQPGAGRGEG